MKAIYPSLKGKRVIVTGGASGIGEGLVEAFAGQGCRVAFVDLNEDAGQLVSARLSPAPLFRAVDLRDVENLAATIAEIEAELGGVDVLVNNAANDDRHEIADVTPAYWDDRIATNLRHVFFAAQSVLPGMRQRGSGVILNFGSISWHRGMAALTLYQTAKAAIEGMTRGMAREVGADGIRVNTIVPGNVLTPRQARWHNADAEAEMLRQQCLKSHIKVSDVAALTLFLASDDARMCTGSSYWLTAGWP
jgi:NAD(P)-dependent dehydrogenase (short-subunit alcohol dehydrogenase family)